MNAPNEFKTLKNRPRTAWTSGDDDLIRNLLPIVEQRLAEALESVEQDVLDTAAGSGSDDASSVLERGTQQAQSPGGKVEAVVARALPVSATSATSTIKWWSLPVPDPVASARSTIQWWNTQIEKAGERFR